MKRILLIGLASLMVLLQGCSRHVVDESQLAQVQTVAVVMYSVPETIVMDARKPKDITDDKDSSGLSALSLAGDLLGGTAKKTADFFDSTSHIQKEIDGTVAAELSMASMIIELNEGMGWTFVMPQQVASNEMYQRLTDDLLKSPRFQAQLSTRRSAGVPTGYINLGLPHGDGEIISYHSNEEFKLWLSKVARALNVDAVIVASDTGYATDGKSLLRGGGCITKSATQFAMFNVNGEMIVDTRISFDESTKIEQSGCVYGQFHKSDYKSALVQHGTDQGRMIVEKLNQ